MSQCITTAWMQKSAVEPVWRGLAVISSVLSFMSLWVKRRLLK